jgi:uncharacterized protein YdaU (DUF1376 family)
MNYYEHHIGDYDADTAHLTWIEDMAYTRLMRLYYRRERPIPADLGEACRLVRATSREQKQAVEAVLREFFELREDGWHQLRCDGEIEKYQHRVAHNQRVGKLGGRPKKEKPEENPPGSLRDSKNNPLHTPGPIHQGSVTPDGVTGGKPPQAAKPLTAAEKADADLWASGKTLYVERDAAKTRKDAGVLLGAAASKYGKDVLREALQATVDAAPINPHPYLIQLCEIAAGKRVPLNRQEALEQRNHTVADDWAAKSDAIEGEVHEVH